MPKLSLWKPKKGNDYKFFDRLIAEQFRIGGTSFLIHKYLGVHKQDDIGDLTLPAHDSDTNVTDIQDLLLLENRDRHYEPNVFDLRGSYTLQENDFDLSQFGLFLSSDNITVEFHTNEMIGIMGRKLMSGDVIELPHLLEFDTLADDPECDPNMPIPKLYKVDDASRSTSGYSPTWFSHIWRVKMSPLTDSQEFRDILGDGDNATPEGFCNSGDDLKNIISTFNDEIRISDAIMAEAERQVPNRNLEHAHLYVMPENENGLPYLFLSDGIPPNGAELIGRGDRFPLSFDIDDWFLRTDFEPNVLFQRAESSWDRKEVDYRKKFETADRILETFINNRNKVQLSSGEIDSKIAISKVAASKKRPPTEV